MNKFKLALLASFAMLGVAQGADLGLPTKAPTAAVVGYPYNVSGFYFGIGTSGTGSQADVAGSGIVAIGASLDGIVGYQWRGGLDFMAVENIASYTNLGNSGNCVGVGGTTTCDINSRFQDLLRFKFGFPISTITNVLPNLGSVFPALPSLPSGTNGTLHPYLYAGLHTADVSSDFGLRNASAWTFQPEVGLGLMAQFSNGLVADTSAGCTFADQGITVGIPGGSVGATLGRKCTARLGLLY